MEKTTSWISNPAAYGVIGFYSPGGKSIGGLSNVKGRVKGYFGSDLIYVGDDEDAAMKFVEAEWNNLSDNIKRMIG